MMAREAPSPGLDAVQLAETIDTIGLLVASLSDRVDAQGRILDKVHQTATEARVAAFAAEKATDWQRNGDLMRKVAAEGRRDTDHLREILKAQNDASEKVVKQANLLIMAFAPVELERRAQLRRWKRWGPWILAGAVVVGVVLALTGAHFLSYWHPACRLVGGRFSTANEDGVSGCFFPEW